ncbi:L-lactate dehydrogenase complex protein LldG [Melghirimyces profundicolus]|uniref:Lactate utilization protein C n=1 Tax=Melghirimyces profundicolus TaxID=1242148 RepID=A0A2T6BFZ0_9BACL|nr:lactate utilization protein C [Melghirimyces profundicolus]PTX54982.1 L-lactate dehydrogenase complex protein LldG [Melghirimyces profundicolus]
MKKGTIHHQEAFLNHIADRLGRKRRTKGVKRPKWSTLPQWNVYQGHSPEQLVDVLKEQCQSIHTDVEETTIRNLPHVVSEVITRYQGKKIVTWDDPRFEEFGLQSYLEKNLPEQGAEVHVWDENRSREKNIQIAERAEIGITFSDITLAESGTVVLFSDKGKGRSVSLLPENYIAIIPKSTIVPRMTQAAHEIHKRVEKGDPVASCVNFISGPSNSADIEMSLVVGVHGPVKVTYVIVTDR